MAGGEWERFATETVVPGLEAAAAALNGRDDLVAECTEHPFGDGCLLWLARRRPPSPFLWPEGSFTIQDEPEQGLVLVEETGNAIDPVSVSMSQAAISIGWVTAKALAFAERLLTEPREQSGTI